MAWKFFSALCLCKLYDLSSLPKPVNQKLAFYTTFVVLVSAFTIYSESAKQIDMLVNLDSKYKQQFDEYMKSSGYEAIL